MEMLSSFAETRATGSTNVEPVGATMASLAELLASPYG